MRGCSGFLLALLPQHSWHVAIGRCRRSPIYRGTPIYRTREENVVFNLVGKRYLFILISLVVIVPGVISLLFKGLNVGIDFRGGTTVELRPDRTISAPALNNLLQPIHPEALEVPTGGNTSQPGNQTASDR